jgi:hypothetical protein
LSAAVAEVEEVKARAVSHPQDRPALQSYGADLTDPELIEEYFEFRDSSSKPGMLELATLHLIAVNQRRRKAKKAKGK